MDNEYTQGKYSARAVANSLFCLAQQNQCPDFTPMKVQKLVYFTHGWHLAITGKPLIRENVSAWPYGPVIEDLYHDFKVYGSRPICREAETYYPDRNEFCVDRVSEGDVFGNQLLEAVWKRYGTYSPIDLSALTHRDGTPWSQVKEIVLGDPKGAVIPNDMIKAHFSGLLSTGDS